MFPEYARQIVIERSPDLPDFERPPVAEVAIALSFEPLLRLRQAHLGSFWQQLRDEYPTVDDRPPVETHLEELGVIVPPAFELRLVEAPRTSRAWFLSADGTRLIQLQADQLILNWRGEGEQYPRFEALAASVFERLEQLNSWAENETLGEVVPRQVEITYVNRLGPEPLASYFTPLNDVPPTGGGLAPKPLDASFATRYDVGGSGGTIGRVYVDARAVADPAGDTPTIVNTLTLVFRAPATSFATSDLERLLTVGRDAMVTLFTTLTTPEQHTHWGRTR